MTCLIEKTTDQDRLLSFQLCHPWAWNATMKLCNAFMHGCMATMQFMYACCDKTTLCATRCCLFSRKCVHSSPQPPVWSLGNSISRNGSPSIGLSFHSHDWKCNFFVGCYIHAGLYNACYIMLYKVWCDLMIIIAIVGYCAVPLHPATSATVCVCIPLQFCSSWCIPSPVLYILVHLLSSSVLSVV